MMFQPQHIKGRQRLVEISAAMVEAGHLLITGKAERIVQPDGDQFRFWHREVNSFEKFGGPANGPTIVTSLKINSAAVQPIDDGGQGHPATKGPAQAPGTTLLGSPSAVQSIVNRYQDLHLKPNTCDAIPWTIFAVKT
jgi:hypothetical protein